MQQIIKYNYVGEKDSSEYTSYSIDIQNGDNVTKTIIFKSIQGVTLKSSGGVNAGYLSFGSNYNPIFSTYGDYIIAIKVNVNSVWFSATAGQGDGSNLVMSITETCNKSGTTQYPNNQVKYDVYITICGNDYLYQAL